jgi:hypothetical protein
MFGSLHLSLNNQAMNINHRFTDYSITPRRRLRFTREGSLFSVVLRNMAPRDEEAAILHAFRGGERCLVRM